MTPADRETIARSLGAWVLALPTLNLYGHQDKTLKFLGVYPGNDQGLLELAIIEEEIINREDSYINWLEASL